LDISCDGEGRQNLHKKDRYLTVSGSDSKVFKNEQHVCFSIIKPAKNIDRIVYPYKWLTLLNMLCQVSKDVSNKNPKIANIFYVVTNKEI